MKSHSNLNPSQQLRSVLNTRALPLVATVVIALLTTIVWRGLLLPADTSGPTPVSEGVPVWLVATVLVGLLAGIITYLIQRSRQVVFDLAESDALRRSLLDNALDPMMIIDDDSKMIEVNQAACLLHGLSRSEMLGRRRIDFAKETGDDRYLADYTERWKRLPIEGQQRGRIKIRRSDGSVRDVEYAATANVAPGRHLAIYRDITEQLVWERELAESRERYQDLFESASDLIVIMSPEGRIMYANRAWKNTLGYDGDLDSHTLFTLVDPESLPRLAGLLRRVGAGDTLETIDIEFLSADSQTIVAEGSLSPKREGGRTVSVRGIFRDVSAQRALESELRVKNQTLERQNEEVRRATKLKSEFLANMSHELRTPLNSIIGFTELMSDQHLGPTTDPQSEALDDVLTSARHLLRLINDILDLSKVEAGRIEFRPERIDLEIHVREVSDILRSVSDSKQIGIRVEIHPTVRQAVLDPSRFKQILYNYLSNALKFSPASSTVDLTLTPANGGMFLIEVRDRGIGIAETDLELLFGEFQQLDSSLSKAYQGTGLGLALTRRLVHAQGGRVTVSSTEGEGSVFGAFLPLDASNVTLEPEVPEERSSRDALKLVRRNR